MLRRSSARSLRALPAFDYKPVPYTGLSYDETVALRAKFLHPVNTTHFTKPLLLAEGNRQYLFDESGNRYIDFFGGVCTTSVGHNHPRVVAAASAQAAKIAHATHLYLHPNVAQLAEKLNSKLPKSEEWVFQFVNSGSEANDFATLMARVYTGQHPVIALKNAYHGMSEGTRGLVCVKSWKHAIPAPAGILRVPNPDAYRGVFGTDVGKYVDEVKYAIEVEAGGRVAAFFAEPFQGVGGIVPQMSGYLPRVYDAVRLAGGVCISDEVQTGFGRLGSNYWGFQEMGVIPDIITCAKSLGNGWPIGAVICKRKIAEAMKGVVFFNTFGGNPICSAVALETLNIIDDEKLQQNCAVVGEKLSTGLLALQKKYPLIGDVRGKGMMFGVELVRPGKIPATEEAGKVLNLMKDRNVVIGKGGNYGNVLRLQGPMCINIDDAAYFLEALDESLAGL